VSQNVTDSAICLCISWTTLACRGRWHGYRGDTWRNRHSDEVTTIILLSPPKIRSVYDLLTFPFKVMKNTAVNYEKFIRWGKLLLRCKEIDGLICTHAMRVSAARLPLYYNFWNTIMNMEIIRFACETVHCSLRKFLAWEILSLEQRGSLSWSWNFPCISKCNRTIRKHEGFIHCCTVQIVVQWCVLVKR
jgi:hypothetical protein